MDNNTETNHKSIDIFKENRCIEKLFNEIKSYDNINILKSFMIILIGITSKGKFIYYNFKKIWQ